MQIWEAGLGLQIQFAWPIFLGMQPILYGPVIWKLKLIWKYYALLVTTYSVMSKAIYNF